jgi:flavodoxin
MNERKALIVCYSRTGVTAKLAAAIAEALDCTVEMLADLKDRCGVCATAPRPKTSPRS